MTLILTACRATLAARLGAADRAGDDGAIPTEYVAAAAFGVFVLLALATVFRAEATDLIRNLFNTIGGGI